MYGRVVLESRTLGVQAATRPRTSEEQGTGVTTSCRPLQKTKFSPVFPC
jgi:hypothetical protein